MKEFLPFRLAPGNQCLWPRTEMGDEERIRLTPKAFAVLYYLVEHAGQLVTHAELLDAVWPETYVQAEVLKSHIFDIRRALGDRAKQPRFIETLARRGYQFIAAVHEGGAAKAAGAAEAHFRHALDWAHRQGALSWERRAATSLAQLWHHRGRTVQVRGLLAPVYDRFTEGFDTADLTAAKALLTGCG